MAREPARTRPRRGIYLLPNLFTTAALFAGFYSVVVAMRGDFAAAAIGIIVAGVFDGLDGRVARLTNTASDFGREYDSLSDMVAFGLAPALVFYQWGLAHLPDGSVVFQRLGWIAAFFFTVTAALRLARFNSRPSRAPSNYFEGLPSPSAAGLVASALWLSTEFDLTNVWVLASGYALTVLTGALMVSNLRYYSFKDLNLGRRIRFTHLLLIPLLFMVIAINPPLVLTVLAGSYALSAPLWHGLRRIFRRRPKKDDAESKKARGRRRRPSSATPRRRAGDRHADAENQQRRRAGLSIVRSSAGTGAPEGGESSLESDDSNDRT
ncbi:MAG: CDP-diacylglycerol--serine O-phosphatidyltransferase [Pseudomonadota bacterium]